MYVTVTVVSVQSDVAINIFCQDQLPVIIGFVLLNTNVLMRIFCKFFWLYSTQFSLYQRRFLTLKYVKKTRLWPGLGPGLRWGSSRRSPRPPSRLTPSLWAPAAPRCLPPPAENPGGAHASEADDQTDRQTDRQT